MTPQDSVICCRLHGIVVDEVLGSLEKKILYCTPTYFSSASARIFLHHYYFLATLPSNSTSTPILVSKAAFTSVLIPVHTNASRAAKWCHIAGEGGAESRLSVETPPNEIPAEDERLIKLSIERRRRCEDRDVRLGARIDIPRSSVLVSFISAEPSTRM